MEKSMEKISNTRSHAAKSTTGDSAGQGDAKASRSAAARGRGGKGRKMTQEERAVAMKFLTAAYHEALLYIDTEEEDIEDEYRRAGRLHVYDPDTEWQKRYARIGRMYNPPDVVAPD